MKTVVGELAILISLVTSMGGPMPGTLDESYQPKLDGPVNSIAPSADGKAYIAGNFNEVNGVARPGLARLNPDGTLDLSFDPGNGANGQKYYTALLVQPDGQLLVTGSFTNFNGQPQYGVARLKPDGNVDPDFHTDARFGTNAVDCLALQPDGKLVIGGNFGKFVAQTDLPGPLARLNADGSVDFSFSPVITHDFVSSYLGVITILPLNMGDLSVQTNGEIRFRATYDVMDTASFPPGTHITGYHDATAMAVQADGRVLAAGYYIQPSGVPKHRDGMFIDYFYRYNVDGKRDLSFTPQVTTDYRLPLKIFGLPDGKIMLIGMFYSTWDSTNAYIARLRPNGYIDPLFKANPDQPPTAFAPQADGSYLVGGSFLTVNGVSQLYLARLYGDDLTPRPPTALSKPTRVELPEGHSTNLTTLIDGPALTYQWHFNGQAIAGATNEDLFITNATLLADGYYSLVASNNWGGTTSAYVHLIIRQLLAEALNTTQMQWKTAYVENGQPTGANGWEVGTNAAQHSGQGVVSCEVFDPWNQVNPGKYYLLQTEVTGPGLLTFWGYGGGQFGFAAASTNHEFYPPPLWSNTNSFETGHWPFGPFEWREYTCNIPEGQQVLVWADEKKFGPPAAIDEVTFVSPPDQPRLRWQRPANGPVALAILGPTGAIYDLERTTDLAQWTKVSTLTNKVGLLEYFNPPTAAAANYSFYRVVPRSQ